MTNLLRHLNRLVFTRGSVITFNFRRHFAEYISPDELICGKLTRRGLLQVTGNEASGFLQGLVTNDMRHFDEHSTVPEGSGTGRSIISVSGMKKSMYAMILNVNGQILFDLIIYNLKSPDEKLSTNFILECDHAGLPELAKLLVKYRLRKNIEINDVTDQFHIWIATAYAQNERTAPEKQFDIIVPEPVVIDPGHIACMTRDPRTPALGWRLLLPRDITPEVVLKFTNINPNFHEMYVNLRHKLGIWEGVEDIPPSECYPLECNADYMHGVSFHKGCYVGQELTARSHHTGVIRKRIMPIIFDVDDPTPISKWTLIENELGRSVGRFISKLGRYGLAQIRMQECFASSRIQIKGHNGKIVTFKPHWWPMEQKKEIVIGREKDG